MLYLNPKHLSLSPDEFHKVNHRNCCRIGIFFIGALVIAITIILLTSPATSFNHTNQQNEKDDPQFNDCTVVPATSL